MQHLLKYDFKGLFAFCLPAYVIGALGGVWNLILGVVMDRFSIKMPVMLAIILDLIYRLTNLFIFLLIIVTAMWIVIDFYKSVFGKIAYLTHTLPVKPHEILISKLISGIVVHCLSALVTGVILFTLTSAQNSVLLEVFLQEQGIFPLIFASIFAFISMSLLQYLTVYCAIALAHLTRYKIALSIVFYLVLSQILGNIPFLAMIFYLFTNQNQSLMGFMEIFTELSLLLGVVSLLLCLFLYFIVLNVMTKKLNLE